VIADIALANRPQHGIGQGVKTGIGVRVAEERSVVVYPNPAEPDVVARPEGVHVKSLPDAGLSGSGCEGLGHGEILWMGEFDEPRVSGDRGDCPAGVFEDLRVVGGNVAGRPSSPRLDEWGEPEGLRGLGAKQPLA
jgi:hypothetical protein